MKNYLLLFLLSITSVVYGQSSQSYKHDGESAAYLVDSIRVNSLTVDYINPSDIKDVYVSQSFIDKETNLRGAIYILTNNLKTYTFLSLDEIKKEGGILNIITKDYAPKSKGLMIRGATDK